MPSSKFHNSALAAHLAAATGLSVCLTTTGGGSPAIEARPVGTLLGEGPHVLILRPTDVDAPLDHAGEYVHGVVVVAYDGTDDDQPTILLEVGVGRAALMGRAEMDRWIAEVLTTWRDAQPQASAVTQLVGE
jgi:hypothetical protein